MEEPKQDKCTPIGVFWDIENCSVPKWRSALWVVQKIRTEFSQGHREVEFMCVCDASKESKVVIQELNSAQVCIDFSFSNLKNNTSISTKPPLYPKESTLVFFAMK